MSIRPEREKKIKNSSDLNRNNDWLQRQIKNMKADTRLHELCKCLTKTPEPKYHKKHCPVWKNGRIAELETALEQIIYDYDVEDERFKKLLRTK